MHTLQRVTNSHAKPAAAARPACRDCHAPSTRAPVMSNQAWQQRLNAGVRTQLEISQPGDAAEQEAERASTRIMRSSSPLAGQAEMSSYSHAAHGAPLPAAVRIWFEPRFGHNLSGVRIHSNSAAAESARSLDARAYTIGQDIFFGVGQYAPHTAAGQKLLAHELTHALQQARTGTRVIARQAVPEGQREAEERAWAYPRFPGCSPHDRRRLDFQITMARSQVRTAIADVQEELDRPEGGAGIITTTRSALLRQFHTERPEHFRTIRRRLEAIEARLDAGPRNFRCIQNCPSVCSSTTALACASPSTPITICPAHFEHGDVVGMVTLVHEAGHQSGRGLHGGPGHYYSHDERFEGLTTAQALNNPDSYALFVRDLRYGGPVVRPLPEGSAAEQPHEREARAVRQSRVWTGRRGMGIHMVLEEPAIEADFGFSDGRQQPIPAAQRQIGGRLRGMLDFFPDAVGEERRRPYVPAAVTMRITLVRASGRRQVLVNNTDPRTTDRGAGSGLGTAFARTFDLTFSSADRGTLLIEASLQDFETATTIRYRELFTVRP